MGMTREEMRAEQMEQIRKGARENPMTVEFPYNRTLGQIAVTEVREEFREQKRKVFVDLASLNPRLALAKYRAKQSRYGTTPFDPEGRLLRLFPGGLTIWSGYAGSGKTALLRQFVCQVLKRGSGIFLASLEESPDDIMPRLAMTAIGAKEPEQGNEAAWAEIADSYAWIQDTYAARFRLWCVDGIASHVEILGAVRQAAAEGIKHAVIDNLAFLDIPNDDYEGQRQFATLLSATARSCDIHIHLVAHPRKLISSTQDLDLNDVAGARELAAVCDNVVFVRRAGDTKLLAQDAQATPMMVSIRKQRHFNGAHGDVVGWFRRDYRQFTLDQFAERPINYLPEEAIKALRIKDAQAVAKP